MVVRYLVRVRALVLAVGIALALRVSSDWRAEASPKGIEWRSWSEDTLSEAEQQGRLVLVSGASKACPWCRKMEDGTFRDEELQRLIATSFIPVRVNLRNREEVPARFRGFVPPTIVVLDSRGEERFAHRGYLSAQELTSALNGVASGRGSVKGDRVEKVVIPKFREDRSIASFNLQLARARLGDAEARQRVSERVKEARTSASSADFGRGVEDSRRGNFSERVTSVQVLVEGGDALRQPEDVRLGARMARALMEIASDRVSECAQRNFSRELGSRCGSPVVFARLMGFGASLSGATGERDLLERAKALDRELRRKGEGGDGGSEVEDSLSIAEGMLNLHSVTAEREVLKSASQVITGARRRFGGGRGDSLSPQERAAFVRVGNLLARYLGDTALQQEVNAMAKSLATQVKNGSTDPRIVEAIMYSQSEPIHIVVVGSKSDEAAQALWDEAIRLIHSYLRREWWDREEGPLPHPDVTYPKLSRPAAFLCAHKRCSLPLFTENELREKIREAVPVL